jgi:hypothetical protein
LSFLLTLKERTKEKAPEITNSALPYARYTILRATGKAEFRTISGLPSRYYFLNSII